MDQKLNQVELNQMQIDQVQMDLAKLAQARMQLPVDPGQMNIGNLGYVWMDQQRRMDHNHMDLGKKDHVQMGQMKVDRAQLDMAKMDHVRLAQMQLDQAQIGQMQLDHAQIGQMKLDHAQMGGMRLDHIHSGQMKMDQVRMKKVGDAQASHMEKDNVQIDLAKMGHAQPSHIGKNDIQMNLENDDVQMNLAKVKRSDFQIDLAKLDHVQPGHMRKDDVQRDLEKMGGALVGQIKKNDIDVELSKMGHTQSDQMKKGDTQINPAKVDHVQPGYMKKDDVPMYLANMKRHDFHTDLAKLDHMQPGHVRKDDVQMDVTNMGHAQPVQIEKDNIQVDLAKVGHKHVGQIDNMQMDLEKMKRPDFQMDLSKIGQTQPGHMRKDDIEMELAKMSQIKGDQASIGKTEHIQTDEVRGHHVQVYPPKLDYGPLELVKLDSGQIDQMKVGQAQGVKRKRVVWDIPTKLKILERLGNGERAVDLAREYGVGRSTISDMKSTESKLREFLSNTNNDSRSRCTMKLSADEDLDRLLYTWFIDERNKGTHLSGPIIREKAKWFHRQLHPGDETFAASQGWLRRWKERHGVTGSVFNLFMGGTKSPGRRSRILDIPAKLKIIERLDNGEQVPDLAKEYGVGKTTITAVMSAKAKLMVYQIQNDPSKAEKYMTKFACYENVDKALYTWYLDEKNKGTPLSGPIVKEKAKWFHDTMYPGNKFKASEGWLWRWKKRNGINGPIGSSSAENKQGEEGDMRCGEGSTDPATEIKHIESTLAQIRSEECKLRKRIYKRRKGNEEQQDSENVKKTPDGKRKRVVLDIPTKLKIIERVNDGERPVDLAREFGLGRSTITDIKLSEARLKTFMSTNDSGSCKRQTMRQPTYESVDKALFSWFVEESKNGIPLPGNILRDKARLLHSQLYPDDSPFLASEGWLRRWKERHGLIPPAKSTKAGQKGERKKRVVLDVTTKLAIIERLHKGENLNHLAKEFGVSKTTINDIKAAEDKLKQYGASCGKNMMKKKFTIERCHEALNKAMYIWFLQERSKGSNLTWPELEARAIWFHKQLHPDCNMMVSSSKWLSQWKSCYGVFQLSLETETSPGLCQSIELFKKHLTEWMVEIDIGPEQLYSAEESTLYWNLLPSKALTCASESDVLDYHRLQDHVTLLTCTNSSGSHKLPVLLLGKSDDPECLKLLDMTNLSVEYAAQKHALISSDIFTNWFHTRFVPEVERHLHSQGLPLRAALLIKNCPAHMPSLEVKTVDGGIECVFLPMSPGLGLNPMNHGSIQYLKHTFRKSLVHKLISARSSLTEIFRNLSLCDCILMIDSAWRSVTEQHILKSWDKSSLMQCFPNSGPIPEPKEVFDIDTMGLSVIQEAFGASLTREDIQDWLNCDQEANSCELMSDSEIVEHVNSLPVQEEPAEESYDCGVSATHDTTSDKPGTVYIKQEIDDEYSRYSDSHNDVTVSPNNSDTEEHQYTDDSETGDSSSSHVVKYFSFSQSEEHADDMTEENSDTVQTEQDEFEERLLSIKEEPKDYDSDLSEGQVVSDHEEQELQDYDDQFNTNAEDDSDMTEEELDQDSVYRTDKETKETALSKDEIDSFEEELE